MPFLSGFSQLAEDDETLALSSEQKKMLLEGLIFLFDNGFVYTDFRPPNILKSEKNDNDVRLIDYDDMWMFSKGVPSEGIGLYQKVKTDLECHEDSFSKCIVGLIESVIASKTQM